MRKKLVESMPRAFFCLFVIVALFVSLPALAERTGQVQHILNLIELGNPDEAIAEAHNAITANARDHEAWAALGIAYIEQGNMTEAEKAIGRAFELERKNGLVRIARGKLFGKRGNVKDALEEFNLALKYDKNDLDAYLALSRYYLTIDSLKPAEINLYRAQAANPNDVRPYIGLGELYEKQRVFDLAIRQYEDAKKLNAKDETVIAKLAQLYFRMRKYTESANEWLNLLRIDSTYKRAYYEVANLFFLGKQFARAASFAEKYVQLDPNALKGHWLYARALSENNEPEKALKSLEYVAAHSDSLRPYTMLYTARGYFRSKDFTKANQIYEEIVKQSIKLAPDDYYYWGYTQISLGDTLGGVEKWKQSLAGDTVRTDDAKARVRLGVVSLYQATRRYDLAGDFLAGLAKDEKSDTNYVKAGQLYFAGEKFAESEAAFNQALARNPNSLASLIGLIDVSAKRDNDAGVKRSYDHALTHAQTAVQKNALGEALGRVAFKYNSAKDYKKSLDWFSSSSSLLSKESKYIVSVHVGWGSALVMLKQYDKAREILLKAKGLDPDNKDVRDLLKFLDEQKATPKK